ncbi:MAG: nicotinamide-nucleotide amidohydrolase family protein [Candidatus Omnitrophica bacterium]|nr:nicotinamide-nucleotide amidohydrolase family protein [Candidatus Omnitrophota bacterium]
MILSRTLRTVGLVELQIQQVLRRIRVPASIQVGLYPHLRAVDVRLTATARSERGARQALDRLDRSLRHRLGETVYGTDEDTLEGVAGERLARRHKTLAVAESCTGGLVSDRLTNVPGSSRYVLLTTVVYHNAMKERLLNVPATFLKRCGAVSAPAVRAMAQGVRRLAGSDLGLAITGIAGPTGGTPKKPVGLVYLALSDRRRTLVQRHRFTGDRLAIKHQAAQTALDWLRRWSLGSVNRAARAPAPHTAALKTSGCSETASRGQWSRAEAASTPRS